MKFLPAKPNELQVDIDRPGACLNASVFEWLAATIGVQRAVMEPSRNGNTHWTVTLSRKLPLLDRICLQAALGDDPVRVMHNYDRAKGKRPHPIVFFEKDNHGKR